jgi:hypothetical protein
LNLYSTTVPFVRLPAEPLLTCPHFIKGWQKYNSISYYPKLNGRKVKNNERGTRNIEL